MPSEFRLTRRIEFAEADMAGIVHFANFFRMMESAEHEFFRSLGFSIHGHEDGATIGWPHASMARASSTRSCASHCTAGLSCNDCHSTRMPRFSPI